jgi:glycine/D-amino acid oxidase-like deaminating enzyme
VPDVVVVGGGALGLSTALHCALLGRSVTLVERDTLGSQASGRAAGLFKSVQADELRTALARRSIDKVCTFADWTGVELPVVRSGSVLVARRPAHQAMLAAEVAASRGWGVQLQEVGHSELTDRASFLVPSGQPSAVWCPEDVYVDEPVSLVAAYGAACARAGVEVLRDEEVVEVTVGADGAVDGVVTSRRRLLAPVVVDAAGAWVRDVLASGTATRGRVDVAVAPVRHQLLVTEPSSAVDLGDPIVRILDAAVYLRPNRGGLMVGGFEADPLPVDPRSAARPYDTADVPLDPAVLERLVSSVADSAPAATGVAAEVRAGLFTMSPDGRFVVGPVRALPGLWVATGCNGSGFSSSPALGEQLAEWLVKGRPTLDLAPLSPDRFGPVSDAELVQRGTWQYAHYYDPAG